MPMCRGGEVEREDSNQYGTSMVTVPGTMNVKIIVLSKIIAALLGSRHTLAFSGRETTASPAGYR
jgi:hypothetical protein